MRAGRVVVSCVGLVMALAACAHEAATVKLGPTPEDRKIVDALWALAPANAEVGFVMSPRGLAALEASWLAGVDWMAATPALAKVQGALRDGLGERFGTANPRLADAGVSAARGLAIFTLPHHGGVIMIVPVVDRARWRKAMHAELRGELDIMEGEGECKPIADRYVCTSRPGLWSALGGGAGRAPGATRGDAELAYRSTKPGGPQIWVTAQLAHGTLTVHGQVTGVGREISDVLGPPTPALTHAMGAAAFGSLNLAPLLDQLPKHRALPSILGNAVAAIGGPLTFVVPAGTSDAGLRIALRDPAPVRTLISQCPLLSLLGWPGVTLHDGVCHVPPRHNGAAFDVWLDGATFRLGDHAARGAALDLAPTPLSRELASDAWSFAIYSRGTLDVSTVGPRLRPLLRGLADSDLDWVASLLSLVPEIGFGVRNRGDDVEFVLGARTIWDNPDDVVRQLLAIPGRDLRTGRGDETRLAIASRAPRSLLADDVKAGRSASTSFQTLGALVEMLAAPGATPEQASDAP